MKWLLKKLTLPEAVVSESAVTAIEYGLIAALIAVAIIGAVSLVGTNVGAVFTNVSTSL
jgi:pilus assembly protein Flp/PilA